MPNNFNTIKDAPGIIAKTAAKMFADELHFGKSIAKADAKDYEGKNGYSAGDTIMISKPARFVAQRGNYDITNTIQDTVEEKVPLKLDILSTVPIEGDSLEFASEIQLKNYIERVIKPAVNTVAHDVEQQLLEKATTMVFNSVGVPGATVFDTDLILSAREKMNKFLAPKDESRYFLHDSAAGRSAVNARKGLFQSSDEIKKQYKKGLVGIADGYLWLESEMLQPHTNGNDVTGVEVDDTVAEGATTIHIDGLTASTGTVTVGSVITFEGVYAVHPITKQAYPFLQQFTVVTGGTADGNGDLDITVSPAMYTSASGGLQNVSALPADGADVVFVGGAGQTSLQNLAFHKDAFRMVSVPLIMPQKAEWTVQQTYKGYTIAIIRDWDQMKRRMVTRLDFLGAISGVRTEWACRLQS